MSRARGARYAGLALALLQLAVHARAGFTFPPPWIDEAQFLWQAKAFADGGTLLAPQLHPERAIRWMPPGWFVLTGSALRVLGFDFALARALSFAWLLGGFALLAWLLRRLPHAEGAQLLAGGRAPHLRARRERALVRGPRFPLRADGATSLGSGS
jgi:hypothetical protein